LKKNRSNVQMTDNFYIFMIASFFEWLAMTILMFSLFRFSLKDYIPQTVFLCLIMSYLSYTLRIDGFTEYIGSIQMVIYVICIWVLFRVHYFYGVFVGISAYHAYLLIQTLVFWLVSTLGIGDINDLVPLRPIYLLTLFLSVSIPILLSIIMQRTRWGFTFVPTEEKVRVSLRKKQNLIMLSVACLDIFATNKVINLLMDGQTEWFLFITLGELIIMLYFLHYSVKREMEA
jgi:hypothetical protein